MDLDTPVALWYIFADLIFEAAAGCENQEGECKRWTDFFGFSQESWIDNRLPSSNMVKLAVDAAANKTPREDFQAAFRKSAFELSHVNAYYYRGPAGRVEVWANIHREMKRVDPSVVPQALTLSLGPELGEWDIVPRAVPAASVP